MAVFACIAAVQSLAARNLAVVWGAPTDVPISGDFDGDGKTDIAIWRPSTGTWWIIKTSTGNTVPNNGA